MKIYKTYILYINIFIYTHIFVCMHICYLCLCVLYIYIYIYIYTHTHIYVYVCIFGSFFHLPSSSPQSPSLLTAVRLFHASMPLFLFCQFILFITFYIWEIIWDLSFSAWIILASVSWICGSQSLRLSMCPC